MKTPQAGQTAPLFELTNIHGERFSLADALAHGSVVVAFFKISCPTCQFTFPFLERLFESYQDERVTFVGISQDDAADTAEFCKEFEVTFPMLLDVEGYPISNDYGITNVPTFFLIGQDGTVQVESTGFSKKALAEISQRLCRFLGQTADPVFLT